MRPLHSIANAAITATALMIALTGCAGGGGKSPSAEATPGDGVSSGEGVSVSVYQPRPDVAAGRMAIQVRNDSDEQLTIERAALSSTYFTDELAWPAKREAEVGPGRAVDLRVQIGESDCADQKPAVHTVTVSYRLGDQASQTTTFVPIDEFEVLDLLHDAACLAERVAEVATLTATSVALPGQPGVPTALTIAVDPSGDDGQIVIRAVNSTTLLAPFDGATGVPELMLDATVDARGPSEIVIPLVPNRCDPHALAEDKVGTRIPLQVTAPDGTTGRLVLSATDELRAQMYAFYSGYCGLG